MKVRGEINQKLHFWTPPFSAFTFFPSCSTLPSPIPLDNLLVLGFTLSQICFYSITLENLFNFKIKPFVQTDSFGSSQRPALSKSLFKFHCCLNELRLLKNLISSHPVWLSNEATQPPFCFLMISKNVHCVNKYFQRKLSNGSLNNQISSRSKCSFLAIKNSRNNQRDRKMHLL